VFREELLDNRDYLITWMGQRSFESALAVYDEEAIHK
jgi:hypothetical protein